MAGPFEAGTRTFVWMVATFAATESIVQIMIAGHRSEFFDMFMWIMGSCAILGLAALIETVKGREEG